MPDWSDYEAARAGDDDVAELQYYDTKKREGWPRCRQCGKKMNPVDAMVGSGSGDGTICGPCVSANHQAAVGDHANIPVRGYGD